ncbi:hypothetical protein AOE01nite_00410 [Acetobacter oeni]|uniref:Flagellar hook-length control protein-like C-terminal domain-containing protein n=1 Tax=Acetobacter oeni TaxID=304077 RepID=A0A511XFT3_9PROT|nr:hypothetical protein AOE01nite_00410 [Acetobacter oeni]
MATTDGTTQTAGNDTADGVTTQSASAHESSSEQQEDGRNHQEASRETQPAGEMTGPLQGVTESPLSPDTTSGFSVSDNENENITSSTTSDTTDVTAARMTVGQSADGTSSVSLTVPVNGDQMPVHVTIGQNEDASGLHIHIGTEALTTLNELQSHRSELVDALESAGVSAGNAQISFGISDTSGNFSSSQQDFSNSDNSSAYQPWSGDSGTFSGESGENPGGSGQQSVRAAASSGLSLKTDETPYISSSDFSRSGINITA